MLATPPSPHVQPFPEQPSGSFTDISSPEAATQPPQAQALVPQASPPLAAALESNQEGAAGSGTGRPADVVAGGGGTGTAAAGPGGSSSDSASGVSTGATVGGVVGGTLFLAAALAATVVTARRHRPTWLPPVGGSVPGQGGVNRGFGSVNRVLPAVGGSNLKVAAGAGARGNPAPAVAAGSGGSDDRGAGSPGTQA